MSAPSDTDPAETAVRHRLAERVKARRQELGLSVRAAADNGGLARGTWIALEEGSRRTSDSNYAGIERVLQWAAGSVTAIIGGGTPTARELAPFAESQPAKPPATQLNERDEALAKVMRSSDITDEQKRHIVELLIAERVAFDRQIAERAEQMIRLARGPE
jgi:transcriptional regulator with XRE-family HTH domain